MNSPQITVGKRPLLEGAASLFDSVGRPRKETKGEGGEVSMVALYKQIGRLKRDQDWLKKSERDWLSEANRLRYCGR